MSINTDQLLNRSSGRLAMQKAQQEKMVGGGSVNIVLTKKSIKNVDTIKTNVVKIESILKGTLALDKKQLDDKKRDVSKKRKEKIETKLETKPNAETGKISMPAAPRMGILDFVKNFIGNVLLGYFAIRLIKHLPKILPIVKFLGNAADFIIDVGGKLLNGLVSFIDAGYKAYDATRGFIKNIGGENFAKGFDKFLGAIDTALFLTTVLAGSMAMESMSGGGGGGPGAPDPRRQPTRTTSGGGPQGRPDIRNPLRQRPTVTTGGGTPRPMSGRPKITGAARAGGGQFKLPSGGSIRSGGIASLVLLIPDIINSGMLVSQGRPQDGIRTFLSAIAGVGAGMAAMAGITAGAAALGITGVGIPAAIALAIAGYAASSAASFLAYEGTNALLKKINSISLQGNRVVYGDDIQVYALDDNQVIPGSDNHGILTGHSSSSDNTSILSLKSGGIIILKNNISKKYIPNSPKSNLFLFLAISSNGYLWSGAQDDRPQGFYTFGDNMWKNFSNTTNPDFAFNGFHKASAMSDGSIWLSNWGGGIVQAKPNSDTSFTYTVYNTTNSPLLGIGGGGYVVTGKAANQQKRN